jgi:hypothetical protein
MSPLFPKADHAIEPDVPQKIFLLPNMFEIATINDIINPEKTTNLSQIHPEI